MKIAVMQPYLFPYLGYYQLVSAVDTFVFFDDVNFIMKGWINRNQILQQNEACRFTLPLAKASQNKLINEIEIANFSAWRASFLKQLELNYKKAPFFSSTYTILHDFFFTKEYKLIRDLAADSILVIANLFDLSTQFLFSSSLAYRTDANQNGQDKIFNICSTLKANDYINPKNGTDLYDEELFAARNLTLNFIYMDEIVYDQHQIGKFVSNLSVIDVLMFNDIEKCKKLLQNYTLKSKS